MEKKRLDKKKIKNANQKLKKNFFETDDDTFPPNCSIRSPASFRLKRVNSPVML